MTEKSWSYFRKNGGDRVGFVEEYERRKTKGRRRREERRKARSQHHHKEPVPATKPTSGEPKPSPMEGVSSIIRELGGGQRNGFFVVNVGNITYKN